MLSTYRRAVPGQAALRQRGHGERRLPRPEGVRRGGGPRGAPTRQAHRQNHQTGMFFCSFAWFFIDSIEDGVWYYWWDYVGAGYHILPLCLCVVVIDFRMLSQLMHS